MPLYEYHCDCGNTEERLLSFEQFDQPQICKCGLPLHCKIFAPNFSISGAILLTREGKAAQGRNMALESINSPTGGYPHYKYKADVQQAAVAGLESPPKTIW